MEISNIYDYLNRRNLNYTLKDDEFEAMLPVIIDKIYDYGFDNLIQDQIRDLKPVMKDWEGLCKKKITTDYISAQCTTGMGIIKRYMPHIYEVENHKGKSIKNLWSKEIIEKVLWVNRKTHSSTYVSEIIRQIGFVAGTSKVTMYRPLLTKRIVEYFNASKVLDPCIGWGGRMLGSVCVDGVEYTGFEPCVKTFNGLQEIVRAIGITDRATILNQAAEIGLQSISDGSYDLILTSPPYYNLEIYSEEESQSHMYGSYEEWITRFLRPVIEIGITKLRDGGKSCWSVKNFVTDGRYNLFDDVKRIHESIGWVLNDKEFYVGNSIRAGLKDADGNPKKGKEITFVFEKRAE